METENIRKLEERIEGIEILLERLLQQDDDSELCDRVKKLERFISIKNKILDNLTEIETLAYSGEPLRRDKTSRAIRKTRDLLKELENETQTTD